MKSNEKALLNQIEMLKINTTSIKSDLDYELSKE